MNQLANAALPSGQGAESTPADTEVEIKKAKLTKAELEFLPAVLEIQETPPSPLGRAVTWLIVVLFVLGIIWASIGKIDIVTVAPGKLVPSARVKVIQALELSKIQQIHVHEGQEVQAGDALVTLDGTMTQADALRLEQDMQALQLKITRLQLFADYLQHNESGKKATVSDAQGSALLQQQLAEFNARQEQLRREQQRIAAEKNTAIIERDKLQQIIPLHKERRDGLEKLAAQQYGARYQYLELQQTYIELTQALESQRSKIVALDAAAASLRAQQDGLIAEYHRNALAELEEANQQYRSLQQEHIKASERNHQQLITAPISGQVQQLVFNTVGGVVSPAQELMRIVPREDRLQAEVYIQNMDIGFVEIGQEVEIKVDTFPFTKYGLVPAMLSNINLDAINDEQRGLVYVARVDLAKESMQVGNKQIRLSPGMSISAEIKTGHRRLIEYFLAPLLRYKQESVRER